MTGEYTPQGVGDETLFDLFDRPSMETPEILLERLGVQGLANLQSSLNEKISLQQTKVQELRSELDAASVNLQSLHADRDIVHQAQLLGNDID